MRLFLASALILSSALAAEEQPCPHPQVVPVVEIGDWSACPDQITSSYMGLSGWLS